MYKVALWGLGDGYNVFVSHHGLDMVEVVAIADKLAGLYKCVDGIPVVTTNKLIDGSYHYDYLVVTVVNEQMYKEIVNIAVSIGIKREIILPLRIFQIPFFNFEDYIKIKESNISILSDYCFAGYLYHKFGMKFMSPTINMYADNENYYLFLQNLKEYMKKPMIKVENVIEDAYMGHFAYPRGSLGGVEWEFNHDVYFESAAERWKRGVERFNWDNYIVIMCIKSDEMAYKFDALPIEHKIGFYWKDLHLESVVCMPEWQDPMLRAKFEYDFASLVNRAADEMNGIRSINWMKALLHQRDFCRVK